MLRCQGISRWVVTTLTQVQGKGILGCSNTFIRILRGVASSLLQAPAIQAVAAEARPVAQVATPFPAVQQGEVQEAHRDPLEDRHLGPDMAVQVFLHREAVAGPRQEATGRMELSMAFHREAPVDHRDLVPVRLALQAGPQEAGGKIRIFTEAGAVRFRTSASGSRVTRIGRYAVRQPRCATTCRRIIQVRGVTSSFMTYGR